MKFNIGKWALSNSKLVYYLVAILIFGGALSYYGMSKLEDPAIKVKQAMVVTVYPGASPYEVELQLTDKIERALLSMKGVDEVLSSSYSDLSIIQVNMLTTVPDDELEQSWDLLRRKVNDVAATLPAGASTSVVVDNYGDVFGMFYALTSDGISNYELSQYAELIQREVQCIDGISQVDLYGVSVPTIEVLINEDRLSGLGVAPAQIISAISDHNSMIYSGYYNSGQSRLAVSIGGRSRSIEDLEEIIIKGNQGDVFKLGDIAHIKSSYAEPNRQALYYDYKPAIGISISALAGTDITKLGREVEALLERLKLEKLPIGLEYNKVFFQPEKVEDAIDTFFISLVQSVAIVIVVLMFAMGFRSGVLLGVTLIVTVIGSILFLDMLGGTLQRVSLAAFILAMGMLVDNAIVIVDGILTDRGKGILNSRALTNIVHKTTMPLLGATIIAILAFLPVFLSPDTAGVYVRDLFIVLAISLLLSWVLSLTMVPLQAKAMFNKPAKVKQSYDSRFYVWLRATLTWSLRHRSITIATALVLVGLTALAYKKIPQSFFPDMAYNQVYIEYKLLENSRPEKTKVDLDSITKYLFSREDVTHVTTSVGATPSRYNLVRSIATPSLSYGDIIVEFADNETTLNAIPEIQNYLTENYPQAYARVKRYNLMYNKYPIEATFKGSDPEVLRELTQQAQEIMANNSDIMLITSDWERRVPKLELDYNQAVARDIGLSRSDVALSIMASTEGLPVETLYNGKKSERIVVKCVDKDGNKIEGLETAPIFSMMPSLDALNKDTIIALINGSISEEELLASSFATTPLSQSVNGISIEWQDPIVVRHNGQRAMRAQANNIPTVGAEDARIQIVEAVEAIPLPEGYSLMWEGEFKAKTKSMQYLVRNIPLSIILMIAILIMLFKDYKKPLIILICVPLLFVGAILGLLLSGKAFGFVAVCGILGLIGMMIKNGIVLMDEINMQISEGKEPFCALLDSSASRFRPVMMASLTTILGMIPLLPDELFGSGAATIMGGLLLGTVITLIFIPVFYSIFFKLKIK